MSRRILVTGGAGFLGRHLCRMIHERGDAAVCLDLHAEEGAPWLSIRGSVIEPSAWETVGKVDAVIHGAAITDLWRKDPSDFDRINRGGAEMAALFAKQHDAPLLLVSSYTVLMGRGTRSETLIDGVSLPPPLDLIGAYPTSKRAGEKAALAAWPQTVIVRPTAPIGPGDLTLTPPMKMTRDVAAGKLPGVMAGRINIVDIRDVAAATFAALDRGKPGKAYLLSGEDLTLRQYAQKVAAEARVDPPALTVPPIVARAAARIEAMACKLTGQPPTAPADGVDLAALPVRFDNRLAREELGFAPRATEEAIRDAVAFLRQEGFLAG
ncbi:NAD-dependent epimerase/dehydratase family protein [Parvularcula lutaonensis]|uniref:NAD-dependent epimerase/dehydratase family protein n=1 Tax=Parvularcula lutaonensis TaxID=491923 RepID=A0ABV7MB32_9PROT|nr:NAD-dependent epimerase/dehydratase family protein [Parvularcula lutaonensis]GGY46243.1 dihydroflavonol-4-reductase [Parvularcula lutaonensis]